MAVQHGGDDASANHSRERAELLWDGELRLKPILASVGAQMQSIVPSRWSYIQQGEHQHDSACSIICWDIGGSPALQSIAHKRIAERCEYTLTCLGIVCP